ncbi:MAG: hypothetical protein K5695_03845 [Oscillospiraceae bacterium]|nr:hypothetical protein [Oscillospiraceae bacterium]
METTYFYNELPAMECFSGDTLPAFHIVPEGITLADNARMTLLIEDHNAPGAVALSKSMTVSEDTVYGKHFYAKLSSSDTSALCGTYRLHFILIQSGAEYEKLTGTLHVRQKVRAVSAS